MAWSVWSVDTVTGGDRQRLPVPASFSWGRVLNSGGSGSAVFMLRDSVFARLNPHTVLREKSRTLVLDWDGVVVYAGAIDKAVYDQPSMRLTVNHSDIWTTLSGRLALDHREAVSKLVNQVFVSKSSGTVAKKMVELAMQGLAGMNIALPITLPADVAGSISRTYYGYHSEWLRDVLQNLMDEDGGTDIDFQPRWVGNNLDWLMRTGSLSAGSYEWHVGTEMSGVLDLSHTTDAMNVATSAHANGEGSGVDKLARSTRNLSPTYPFADRMSTFATETSADALSRYALGELNAYSTPTEQWSFSILASGSPKVSDLLLGGTAKTWMQDDPWLTEKSYTNRIIGFSGDLSETVKLQFQ
jgi:hypothetical protein